MLELGVDFFAYQHQLISFPETKPSRNCWERTSVLQHEHKQSLGTVRALQAPFEHC